MAADVRELGLHQETGNATYVPLPQVTASTLALSLRIVPLTWAVRTRGAPLSVFPAVADALRQEAGLPVARVRSMDQVLRHSTARDRFNAVLFGMFALLAVTLAALGLYGLMAYSLEQRTREFGIRMALGSSNSQLKYMVVRQALTLAVVGILAGLGGALAFTRAMAGLLFGVKPADPLVFAAVAVLLLVVAWAASLAPARRTVRIDPAAALRSE
ncbi:MAG TPA: FtsX-like permease family protein [Candidatus Sulfopaludibacter sp.]|nr:FtsX-like permease family protein [Candidatus Sulfopaludibacter sp.]